MKYKAKVSGDYKTKSNEMDEYDVEVIVNTGEIGIARSIIQNGVITDILKNEKKDYKTWLTCQVDELEPVANNTKLQTTKEYEELLARAAEIGCVPTNLTSFKKIETREKKLKEAVKRKEAKILEAKEGKKTKDS